MKGSDKTRPACFPSCSEVGTPLTLPSPSPLHFKSKGFGTILGQGVEHKKAYSLDLFGMGDGS